MPPSEIKETAIKPVNRRAVLAQCIHILHSIRGFHWEPRLGGRKSGMGCGIPLHGRTTAIAPHANAWCIDFGGITDLDRRKHRLFEADLIAVIDGRCAAQCQQKHCRNAGLLRSDPARNTCLVMISKYPIGPAALRKRSLILRDEPADLLGVPWCAQQGEIEW